MIQRETNFREMTDNLLYRIPDKIYQKFFCAKVVLNRLPTQIIESPDVEKSDSSSDESGHNFDKSYEYYLENTCSRSKMNNNSAGGIMITRSAWKMLNRDLPTDCELETLEPIPKIIIKKKSKKVTDKIKAERASADQCKKGKSTKNISTLNYAKKPPNRKLSRASLRKRGVKSSAPTIITQRNENTGNSTPVLAKSDLVSAEQSTRPAQTGYSSAADSTTNGLLPKPTEDISSKPILNYILMPKSRRGRKCCMDFVILPPTEPVTPSKMVSIPKLPRGRPRNISGVPKLKPKPKSKVVGIEKKTLKKCVTKNKFQPSSALPLGPSVQPVMPGKSLPIIEGPPNMARAAWIKEQLMAEDFMCRIPPSKISRIPRGMKTQLPPIKASPKPEKPQTEIKEPLKIATYEPKNIKQLRSNLEIATSDTAKATISDPSIDWFPQDLDLGSLNKLNYYDTDMVFKDKYYPKNSSFTSTPYMSEKLATDTLTEMNFDSKFFNYSETGCGLVTPGKVRPPALGYPNIREVNDDRCIPITVNEVDAKTQISDFNFKRPYFDTKLCQVTDEYVSSPASEPLDLSVRTGLSQYPSLCNIKPKYAPSLSPRSTGDVLLDASYMGINTSPWCNSNERFENYTMVPQRGKNDRMDALVSDMDAMIREHEQYEAHSVPTTSREPYSSNYFLSQDNLRNSKMLSELSKITRTIRFNELEPPSQEDHVLDVRAPTVVGRQDRLQYNSNVTIVEMPRVTKIFGFPCFRFLVGKCVSFPCKFSHQLIEPRVLQAKLVVEPVMVLDKCYTLIVRYDMLFTNYFESFCILYGKRQMIPALIHMKKHCERVGRPIGFLRHIVTGLSLCNLDKVQCYATLVQNIGPVTKRSIDVLIEIMLELDVVLKFTDKLEEFLKRDLYRINIDLFDRMLGVGKRTKDPELIRILLETINSYPSECQKRLNSILLSQFLQMVRNLKTLRN